jgi:single-stranded DNA-binding protein
MANIQSGRIINIAPIQTIRTQSGNEYLKREITLDATRFDPYTGERDKFENFPTFEFGGQLAKDLDNFRPGQVVTITFELSGTKYQDKQTGETKYFTRIRGYKIEPRQQSSQPQQSAPQQQSPQPQRPAPQPQYQMPPQMQQAFQNWKDPNDPPF